MLLSLSSPPAYGRQCVSPGSAIRSPGAYRMLPCPQCSSRYRSRAAMSTGSRRARVTAGPPGPWVNKHRNVIQDFDRLYSILNPPGPVTDFFGDLQLTAGALQGLIRDAIRDNMTLRAIGGGWSLSRAAVTDGCLIDTLGLNWAFPADATSIAPGYSGDPSLLMYLQCGVS